MTSSNDSLTVYDVIIAVLVAGIVVALIYGTEQ